MSKLELNEKPGEESPWEIVAYAKAGSGFLARVALGFDSKELAESAMEKAEKEIRSLFEVSYGHREIEFISREEHAALGAEQ